MATTIPSEKEYLDALSRLVLSPDAGAAPALIERLDPGQRAQLLELADSHHVVMRALLRLEPASTPGSEFHAWIAASLARERARIDNALMRLEQVLGELQTAGLDTVVMKSLDHWPDVGNDLDLYTTGDGPAVVRVFTERLGAAIELRSWGDRIAGKWNFRLPGLNESIEVHAQRLGQMGEHRALARRFVTRRVTISVGPRIFPAPAPEERIIVATLQRMYRHFYFRLCDIANSAALVESGTLDYAELRRAAELGGIWPGVASYLQIVSDYIALYRGRGLDLPPEVRQTASFGGDRLKVVRRFLRIPLMPEGAELYTRQVASTALRGDLPATFRLSLLPPLAATAAVAFRLTGNDKGIW